MAMQGLVKVKINRFMHFKCVEINIRSCNLVNICWIGKDVVQSYVCAFEFLFANKELSIESIQFDSTLNIDHGETTYVEATVQLASGITTTLQKSVIAGSFRYRIDEDDVSKAQFSKALKDLKLFYTYTSFIKPGILDKIMQLSEESRGIFIDNLANQDGTRALYLRLQAQIEDCRMILKYRNDQIKEHTADKKATKLGIDNAPKIRSAECELQEKQQQYTLFKVFHNEQAIENATNKIASNIENYSQLLVEYNQSLSNFRDRTISKVEFEKKMRESYDRFKQLLTIRHEMAIIKVKHEYKMNDLFEQKSSNESFTRRQYKEKTETKLTEIDHLLQQLREQKEDFEGSFDEYYRIQLEILKENPKYISYLSCQKLQNQIDAAKENEVIYQNSIKRLESTAFTLNQELKHTKNQYTKHKLEKDELQKLILNQEAEIRNNEAIVQAYERLLAENRLKFHSGIVKIAEVLKQKFPDEIIGILSDLFETNESQDFPIIRNGIIELLGQKGDSIIVRNSAALKKCTDYIISIKNLDFNVVFVPMDSWQNSPMETKSPSHISGVPIEHYIKPYNEAVKRIVLEYLQPMLVCESQELSVFKAVAKKVAVTNFKGSLSLTTNGFVVFSNIELMHADENYSGIITYLQDMRIADINKRIDLAHAEYQLKELDNEADNLMFTVTSTKELLDRVLLRSNHLNTELAKIKAATAEKCTAHKQIYAKMTEEFQDVIGLKFRDTLNRFGFDAMDDFVKTALRVANSETNTKILLKVQDIYRKLIETFPNTTFSSELSKRIEALQSEIDKARDDDQNDNPIDFTAEIADAISEREKVTGMNEQIEEFVSNSGELTAKLNSLVSDTFVLLNSALMMCEDLPEGDGERLSEVLSIPRMRLDDDFIQILLNNLKVDTSELDDNLKEETDVAKKARELELDIKALNNTLKKFPVFIEGDKEGLKAINHYIKRLETKINKTSKDHEEFADLFKKTRVQRINHFNECLKVMNEEIASFCRVALNGTITAELHPVDDVEPYLNKVQFYWRSENSEACLNESNNNHYAALAFLLGILKYKNQQHINYVDDSDMNDVRAALQKFCESNSSNLQCSILISNADEDEFHNTIVPSSTTYKIVNHND